MTDPVERIYTSRVIKATALLADTKSLLHAWDLNRPVAENFEAIRSQNLFGKTSRSRLADVLRIFHQRYFLDPSIGEMLVSLVQNNAPAQWIDPLLYFFSAQNDRTVRDVVLEVLYPRKMIGYTDTPVALVYAQLREWSAQGKTTSEWNEKTIVRVGQNMFAALRDFGVLEGKVKKRITAYYLPLEPFVLIAMWLLQRESSGSRVLHSDDWKLFFLDTSAVERNFIEAQLEHLLTFDAAGSIIRLEFRCDTLKDYVHVVLERARSTVGG